MFKVLSIAALLFIGCAGLETSDQKLYDQCNTMYHSAYLPNKAYPDTYGDCLTAAGICEQKCYTSDPSCEMENAKAILTCKLVKITP